MQENKKFIAMINLAHSNFSETLLRVVVDANNKEEVKEHLLENHAEFFEDNKVNQRRKKDSIVYTNIFELSDYWTSFWLDDIVCEVCGFKSTNLELKNQDMIFSDHSPCCNYKLKENEREDKFYKEVIYIYKITHKSTNMSYVGQTKNHFVWRWWDHIKAGSGTKFHQFMENIDPREIIFEVIDIAYSPEEATLLEATNVEKFDCINNGFNTVNPIAGFSTNEIELN